MALSHEAKSWICIIGGALLLLSAVEIIFKLTLALLGIFLIVYGIQLRSPHRHTPHFMFVLREWFF